MAITYPLTIPGPIYPDAADLKKFDAVAEFLSPFDGTSETQTFQDQHWELDLEWPPMTWPQFAALDAFHGALHGKVGSFLWGPPLATGPRGLGLRAGTPLATGADATGSNLLHTSSWLPNQKGILLPGDFLTLEPSVAISFISVLVGGTVSIGVTGLGSTPPAGLAVGTIVYLSGTGLSDGGPFVLVSIGLLLAVGGHGIPRGWLATFNNPAAIVGVVNNTGIVAYGGLPRLYQYTNPLPLDSDGGGNAPIDIFPSIREAPPAGVPVVLLNPQGTFRLDDNRRSAPAKRTKTYTFSMKCREAI